MGKNLQPQRSHMLSVYRQLPPKGWARFTQSTDNWISNSQGSVMLISSHTRALSGSKLGKTCKSGVVPGQPGAVVTYGHKCTHATEKVSSYFLSVRVKQCLRMHAVGLDTWRNTGL